MRTAWKGRIGVAGLSAQVKAYAANNSSTINFVTVHRECPCEGSKKLEHRKHCPNCDRQVASGDVGRAYDAGDGVLIPVKDEEIDACKVHAVVGVDIHHFAKKGWLSLRYSERSYYLEPETGHEQTLYTLAEGLNSKFIGLGDCVLQGRVRPCVVEADGPTIIMHMLNTATAMRKPVEFNSKAHQVAVSRQNVKLMKQLITKLLTDPDGWNPQADPYLANLSALINGKRSQLQLGQVQQAGMQSSTPVDTSLADALTASLKSVGDA